MPRDDTKDGHIRVVVTEGQKARWSKLVEVNEKYDSLSDYLRADAEKQYTRELQGGEVSDTVESMPDDVLEEVRSMVGNLSGKTWYSGGSSPRKDDSRATAIP